MKVLRRITYILIFAFLSACGNTGSQTEPGIISKIIASPTSTLPTPQVTIIPVPDAKAVITKFLQSLQKNDYASMYDLLSKDSRAAISSEDFSKKYNNALNIMSAASIEYTVNSAQLSPRAAEVAYSITYKTTLAS